VACVKLVVLHLLQNPEIAKKYPYPEKLRRPRHANYYEAYKHYVWPDGREEPQGWLGQELRELVNLIFPTQVWRCGTDLMYNHVLSGGPASLEANALVTAIRTEPVRKGHNSVWYTLNHDPYGDPNRPIARIIEQDKENLAAILRDSMRFLVRLDELVYNTRLYEDR
jgi:hypothetical protein